MKNVSADVLKILVKACAQEGVVTKGHMQRLTNKIRKTAEQKGRQHEYVEVMGHRFIRLQSYRDKSVKPTARAIHLAACFMRGTPYEACEDSRTKTKPDYDRVESFVRLACREHNRIADREPSNDSTQQVDIRQVGQRLHEWMEAA